MAVTKIGLGRQTDLNANAQKITGLLDGTAATDAATKGQLDAVAAGLDSKASVRAATTTAGTLASSFENADVIDGVTLATGDHILIKDQSAGAENGIYVVNASGAPTRRSDFDTSAKVTGGATVFINEGTVNADSNWTLITNDPITLNTTALVFTQTSGLGQITVDSTIVKTGNQLARAAITGDITISSGSNASVIGANKVTLGMQATLAANSAIANATGGTATPTAVPMVSAPTASAIAIRDTNANARFNNAVSGLTTTATAAGTTTLTVASTHIQQFTGSTTQTLVMPDATTLSVGHSFRVTNRSSGAVTVNANGGGLLQLMAAGSSAEFTAVTIGTAAGTWDVDYRTASSGGTVTSVSVVSANGFNGTVATSTTTPAITLTTTVTGLLKGNGTAISAATAGTDYVVPTTFVDRETPSGTVNGSNVTFTLANTPISGTESVYLNGILQDPGAGNDYQISGTTITYGVAPLTGDKIRVSYRR